MDTYTGCRWVFTVQWLVLCTVTGGYHSNNDDLMLCDPILENVTLKYVELHNLMHTLV